jgi:hypothetical protein
MNFFEWLENTHLALFIAESVWAYPLLLSLHIIGLAIAAGIFVMLDLRLLGKFNEIRTSSFLPLVKFAWVGFLINAISGVFLFIQQAVTFAQNTTFLIKICLIFIGAIMAGFIQSQLREFLHVCESEPISKILKITATLSLAVWFGAIIAGRLIAYL